MLAYEHYIYAALAVLGTGLAVWGIGLVLHSARAAARLAPYHGVVPPFINILGVLFGLTLAFIGNDTWSSRDRAMDAVFREADGIRALRILADGVADPLGAEIGGRVQGYGQALVAEWPALRERSGDAAVSAAGDELLAAVARPEVAAQAGENVQALMLAKVSEIRAERDLRISLSRTHLNPLKWLGMAFLGLMTLLSIAAVHLHAPRAGMLAVSLFAVAAAPSAAIVLVQGNPFQPPAAVGQEALLEALGEG